MEGTLICDNSLSPFHPISRGKSVENLLSVGYITNFPFNPNPPEHPVTSHRWPVTARPPQTSTRRGSSQQRRTQAQERRNPAFVSQLLRPHSFTQLPHALPEPNFTPPWTIAIFRPSKLDFSSSNAHLSRLFSLQPSPHRMWLIASSLRSRLPWSVG